MTRLEYQRRYGSSTVTRILKTAKVFLSIFSVVSLTQSYLKFESLTKQLREVLTQHRPLKQRKKANQIVQIVLLDMMPTRIKFGVLAKWKPIMYRLGVKGAKQ